MKIVTKDAVYVQKNDIVYLSQMDLDIPTSIFMKVFGTIIDDTNKDEFVKFDLEEEIEILKKIDWIIDYNEFKDLSEREIIDIGQSILEEKKHISSSYNSMTLEENKNMITKCELIDFKMCSLGDILAFKKGCKKIKLPDEICPEKGIRKLLKEVTNKMKK